MSDPMKRALVWLLLIALMFVLAAIVAPCDGSCTVAEEVARG